MEDACGNQVLENDMKCGQTLGYDFVGDVVRDTGFPWVNFSECVSDFAEPDSVWVNI